MSYVPSTSKTPNSGCSALPLNPLVTILMPALNAAKTIGESISSVFNQTYPHWELLIVDDGSTDATASVVSQWSHDKRIQVLSSPARRSGPAIARNVGLRKARGRLIAFLDSDDTWRPEKLERQIAFMRERGAVFSFTAYHRMDGSGQVQSTPIQVPAQLRYRDMLKTNGIGCLTVMFDRAFFPTVLMPPSNEPHVYGFWLRWLKGPIGHEDYGLWLNLLRHRTETGEPVVAHGLNEPLACYRISLTNMSRNKLRALGFQWLVLRKLERLPLLTSAYYLANYAARGFVKHI